MKIFKNKSKKIIILIPTMVLLLISTVHLFIKSKDYYYKSLTCESVSSLSLNNTLKITKGSFNSTLFTGEIVGFVKFINIENQPKDLRQYYIIKPTSSFDDNLNQIFSLEEVLKLSSIPPITTKTYLLYETDRTNDILTLEDDSKNKFKINFKSGQIYLDGTDGDQSVLITNDSEYFDFIWKLLNENK